MTTTSPPAAPNEGVQQNNHGGATNSYGHGVSSGKKPLFPDQLTTHVLKLSTPAKDSNKVNLPLLVKTLLTELLKHCPGLRILPKKSQKSKHLPLTHGRDVPCSNDIEVYATDLQYDARRQQHHVYIEVETTYSFSHIKYGSQTFLSLLQEKKIWITRHAHSSRQAMSIGHVTFLHPGYGSRDSVTTALTDHLVDIEFILAPSKQFFYKDNKRTNVEVVDIIVSPKDADETRAICLEAFGDSKANNLGDMDFIPLIQNGVPVEMYRSALQAHYEWCQKTVSVSIEGVFGPHIRFSQNGEDKTFHEVITEMKDSQNNLIFTGIEKTKDTETKGRYLLLTTKDNVMDAQKTLDVYFRYLKDMNKMPYVSREGIEIRRTNNTFTSDEMKYTEALAKKYGNSAPSSERQQRRGRSNAWMNRKRDTPPQVLLTVDDDTVFPHLAAEQSNKRSRPAVATQEPIDLSDDATAATSVSMSSEMLDNARKLEARFLSASKQHNATVKDQLNEIKSMKEAIANSNKQVIKMFETSVTPIQEKAEQALERTIAQEKTQTEMQVCMQQMARVLVNIPNGPTESPTSLPFAYEQDRLRDLLKSTPSNKRNSDAIDETVMEIENSEKDPLATSTQSGAGRGP